MKIKYLGTGASTAMPSYFCECDVCKYARIHKGKEIRKRMQAIVNDKLLIDFGPDSYIASLMHDVYLPSMKHILITHSHPDHLYIPDLLNKRRLFAFNESNKDPLILYGGQGVEEKLNIINPPYVSNDDSIIFKRVEAYKPFKIDEYDITPLPANHTTIDPLIFVIRNKDKSILYAHDTGPLQDEVFSYLKEHKHFFNFVSLDFSEGISEDPYPSHMNLKQVNDFINKLKLYSLIDDSTILYVAHLSHKGFLTHKAAVKLCKQNRVNVAYDGLEVVI